MNTKMLGTWVFISYCLEIKENIDLWPVQCIEVPNFRWQSSLSWKRYDFWALLINSIIQRDWIMWPSWECYWVLVKWPLQLGWCLDYCSDFRKDRSGSHWQFLAFLFFFFQTSWKCRWRFWEEGQKTLAFNVLNKVTRFFKVVSV